VKSDSGDLNYKSGIDTYIGHVTIIRGAAQLEADKAITYLDKSRKLQKAIAFGNPAHMWQKATGQETEFHAYAKRIEYYPNQNLIILIGDGKIIHDNNTLQAPYITYNIQNQTLTTQPSKAGRTTIIIRKNE
jgi:lipopolysaccharide transport protein LptA